MRARENPFRTERLRALPFRHPEGVPALGTRLDALGRRAAIVGDHGSGKTTLLGELGRHLEGRGFTTRATFVSRGVAPSSARVLLREARSLGPREVWLFDGAGHLPVRLWRSLRRASRAAGGLVVTAHSEGLLPTLVRTRTDVALLASLVEALLPSGVAVPRARISALFDAHRGNLRDALLALYDDCAGDAFDFESSVGNPCRAATTNRGLRLISS